MQVKLIRAAFIGGEYVEPPKPGKGGKPPKDEDGIFTVSEEDGRNLIAGGKALPIDVADGAAPENRTLDGSGELTRD